MKAFTPRPTPSRWVPGDSIGARKLNSTVDAVRDLLTPGISSEQLQWTARLLMPVQYRIKSVGADWLVCRKFSGFDTNATEAAEDTFVAKPFLLRRAPFDGLTHNGINYVYTTDVERVADTTETQVVTPPFVVDDIIYAQVVYNGPVLDIDASVATFWLDVNVDARAWAVKFGA